MLAPREFFRLLEIHRTLVRHGLDELLGHLKLSRTVRGLLLLLSPGTWFRHPGHARPRGVRIRESLEELGPIFVKFGQALSTRRDLLPADVAEELVRLQDRVPPFPAVEARTTVEAELRRPVAELFRHFEVEPMASASIAQVHAATLNTGEEAVVKVLRPGVEDLIRRDVDVLYALARLADRYWKEAKRLRPLEVVAEFDKTLTDELDLLREAANAATLRRNFEGSGLLYIPEPYWDLCTHRVMVMERIGGIPVGDVARLRAAGTDMKLLSERAVEVFFTQVFRDNFFHADMHPGNIFVDTTDPADPFWVGVDFGIVGSLSPADQHYLAANFVAFFNRDYKRVAELHVESGWVQAHVRVDEFEGAIRTVCEPIFNRPLKEISFGQLLVRLFQVARRFDMEVQPQLVLLQKTLLNVEGLGRDLYPDLDLWQTAKPFLERWTREQVGVRGGFNRLREHWPEINEALQDLPQLLHRIARKAADGELAVRWENPELARIRATLERQARRRWGAVAGAAGVLAAAILLGTGFEPAWLGWGLGAGGLVALAAAYPGRG